MAVVIKDFEVVTPPPDAQHGTPPASSSGGGQGADRAAMANEVEALLRMRRERQERLHAC